MFPRKIGPTLFLRFAGNHDNDSEHPAVQSQTIVTGPGKFAVAAGLLASCSPYIPDLWLLLTGEPHHAPCFLQNPQVLHLEACPSTQALLTLFCKFSFWFF